MRSLRLLVRQGAPSGGPGLVKLLEATHDSIQPAWLERVNNDLLDVEVFGAAITYAVLDHVLRSTSSTWHKCCPAEALAGLDEISANRYPQVAVRAL